ncbi:tetratricopeptide repeat protein [Microcoleus sp. POL10_C6]|uniref:tetratricopeptide repeat protein n=1 Tax=Microcoleus sp. POL10_C6 TaxID=2818852 RepID=UPI002FD4A802
MLGQIWQSILNLWRQIQRHFRKGAPPPPKPTPIRSFGEYEQKFMALLEGVEQGWSRGEIKGFLIGCKIKDTEWVNWLQEFGERLLVSPETNLELGGRMVRLGEMNCGKMSEVAGNIGRQLLAGESLNRNPADDSSVISENILTRLLAREGWSVYSTENSSAANQRDSTLQAEYLPREISQEAIEFYNQGVEHDYKGDLEGAIVAFEKALEIDSKYHLAWYNLGNTLKDLGRYKEAIAAFKKVLEIDPKYHHAWYGQGATLNALGRYRKAIAAFEKALEIDPKDHYPWNGLGNALSFLGRYTKAIAAYEKALEIDPQFHYAWNGLGTALTCLGRYSEAEAAFHKALEITGDQSLEAWVCRGWVFFYSGRYSEAIQNWDEGLKKYQPSNCDYRLACSTLHQQKDEALRRIRQKNRHLF